MSDDKRLIEDFLPIEAINEVAQGEERGHLATHPRKLHRWWARRPLAAARAVAYATLVRADDTPKEARSPDYFRALCRWGASDMALADARKRVLAANGGESPRVLDLFAGGGAIPLEAARLGCHVTAIELNPVAHLIERCMLEYPQDYGPELANDIRYYGERWISRTWDRVGHLYPRAREIESQLSMTAGDAAIRKADRPIAYLWTRTVRCPNPVLEAHDLPLVRQTWLAKKKGRFLALRPRVDRDALKVRWELVQADTAQAIGFDPTAFSSSGRATCLVCGASVNKDYVKTEGIAGRMGITPLAAVILKPSGRGRDYLAAGEYLEPTSDDCKAVLTKLECQPPEEPISAHDTRSFWTPPYGLTRFRDLFTPRQLATLCSFAEGVKETHDDMLRDGVEAPRAEALAGLLALTFSRLTDFCTTLCIWHTRDESLQNTFRHQALPMAWDFMENNPFGGAAGDASRFVESTAAIVESLANRPGHVDVVRASASQISCEDGTIDAVLTDPPYYDYIPYADLSDFFYVWLRRSVGFLFPEHLGGELSPKRREAIVASYRHGGSKDAAREFYEAEMAKAFAEAHRVLKPGAPLVCVYAHKTTLGWASLVEALRKAGFTVTEAWPLDTEMTTALKNKTASLASSIFLVARRRETEEVGEYRTVLNQLDGLVKERLKTLTDAGVTGSDLVIATMGAALRPYTRFASVELRNGEELPAERFLEEVQSRVLGAVLREVHGLADGGGGLLDPATRYYVLARFSYGYGDVPFDEANNLARTAGVELENGLVRGNNPLARSSSGNVHFYDYTERGECPELGLDGLRLVDVLHGLLWRAARRPGEVEEYLHETRPDVGKLRVVAQALQGRALRSDGDEGKAEEAQACERLLGSWRTLVEDNLFTG